MPRTWMTGKLVCEALGLRYDKAMIRLAQSEFLNYPTEFKFDFEIDTSPQSGDFEELIRESLAVCKNAASGRDMYIIPDDEWFRLGIIFGTKESITKDLRARIRTGKEAFRNGQFKDSLTEEELAQYGTCFGGERHSFGSVWFERSDKTRLQFVGVGGAEDIYSQGKLVQIVNESWDPVRTFTTKESLDEYFAEESDKTKV